MFVVCCRHMNVTYMTSTGLILCVTRLLSFFLFKLYRTTYTNILFTCIFLHLQSLLTPLLDNDPAVYYQETLTALERARHQAQDKLVQRYCGKQFASTTQLTQSGRMFAMMINGKNLV